MRARPAVRASSTAASLVNRRGENGSVSSWRLTASMTRGWRYPTWWTLLPWKSMNRLFLTSVKPDALGLDQMRRSTASTATGAENTSNLRRGAPGWRARAAPLPSVCAAARGLRHPRPRGPRVSGAVPGASCQGNRPGASPACVGRLVTVGSRYGLGRHVRPTAPARSRGSVALVGVSAAKALPRAARPGCPPVAMHSVSVVAGQP